MSLAGVYNISFMSLNPGVPTGGFNNSTGSLCPPHFSSFEWVNDPPRHTLINKWDDNLTTQDKCWEERVILLRAKMLIGVSRLGFGL